MADNMPSLRHSSPWGMTRRESGLPRSLWCGDIVLWASSVSGLEVWGLCRERIAPTVCVLAHVSLCCGVFELLRSLVCVASVAAYCRIGHTHSGVTETKDHRHDGCAPIRCVCVCVARCCTAQHVQGAWMLTCQTALQACLKDIVPCMDWI